jgi:major vault protein
MAERDLQDLVVAPGQYALLLDSTKGNVDVLVGPTKTSLSNTDYPVRWNRQNRTFDPCSQNEAKQQFPTAPEGYYIVLENPVAGSQDHPVGGSRSATVALATGQKVNIPGPCSFALYPGQAADVVPGHHLRSNQYLVVRVYNDIKARETWNEAVVKTVADGEDSVVSQTPPTLNMGQLLIIKGTEVSFYIPPTGIEVLRDETGNYVRDAETLERLEFCILLNENGDKRYVVGPAVVFPEPTETFLKQAGSRKGRAIELNHISGVYVKVIAAYDEHEPGDELFITGKEQSIYYPRPEHSLIKYGDRVIHYAVAVPEGEGRYVLNRITGDVRIERGPSMFLPDPRKEVIVRRILSDVDVSLLYPENREALEHNRVLRSSEHLSADDIPMASMMSDEVVGQAYRTSQRLESGRKTRGLDVQNLSYAVSTSSIQNAAETMLGGSDVTQRKSAHTVPRTITLDTKYDGVVAVDVWSGYATLFVRKNGDRRVVVGPKTVLLEYDEHPIMLELSTGTPKTDHKRIRTGFLRIVNNSVSDEITAETSDAFDIKLRVRYHINFTETAPEIWFNVENYVQFLAERMRSIIRRTVKQHSVREIKDSAIDLIRTLVLGSRDESTGKRPGRVFYENNMLIFDADVETPRIEDGIDDLFVTAEQKSLRQQLELQAAERDLLHIQRIEDLTRQRRLAEAETDILKNKLDQDAVQRGFALKLKEGNAEDELKTTRLTNQVEQQDLFDELTTRDVLREKQRVNLELYEEQTSADIRAKELLQKAQAISPELAKALERVGEEAVLQALAKAMAPLSILGGENVADVVRNMLSGTKAEEFLTNLLNPGTSQ